VANKRGGKVPWRTRGDYFSFRKEAIRQHAPAVSGVYGLFNFHHQILIDSADNIRVALLHHVTNTNFRIGRLRPTGFIFEPCEPETRDKRVQELIREYSPLVQARGGIGFLALWRSFRSPGTRAFHPDPDTSPNIKGAKLRETTSEIKSAGHPRFERKRFDIAGAACAMIFLSVGFVAVVPQLKNIFRNYLVDRSLILADSARPAGDDNPHAAPMPAFKIALAAGQPGEDIIAGTLISTVEAQESAAATDLLDVDPQETAAALTSTFAVADNIPETPKSPPLETPVPLQQNHENYWTVQVLATTDRQFAAESMQRLKLKGYEAFVTEALVRGHIWHRVRVGNLSTRQAAESLRDELASQERIHEPFIARNGRFEHPLTLNRR
jgi:cell division septation protein DedD